MITLIPPGIRFMLAGTVCFGIGSLFVKLAGETLPTLEILFSRAVVGIAYCLLLLRGTGVPVLGHRKKLLLLRGLLGFAALSCNFYSFIELPLSEATVLLFLHPIFVAIIAVPVLGERLGTAGVVSIAVSVVGLLLVTKPAFLFGKPMPLPPLAVAVAILGALFSALAIITVRALAQTENPLSVIIYAPLVIGLLAPLTDGWNWILPDATGWALLLGVGLTTNVGQHLMTKGYQLEHAAPAAATGYIEIIIAVLLGWLAYGHIPDMLTILGSGLIMAGTLAVALTSRRSPPAHPVPFPPHRPKGR